MESNELIKFCLENGLLLDKDLLKFFNESMDVESAKKIIEKLKIYTNKKIITKTLFEQEKNAIFKILSEIPESVSTFEKLKINLGLSIEILKEVKIEKAPEKVVLNSSDGDIKILSNYPALSKKIEVKDFVTYFRSRFNNLRDILNGHPELENLTSIDKISGSKTNFSLIGLLISKSTTKNKNMVLEIEDLTGKIKVLINKDKEDLYKKADDLPLDCVVGFKGNGNKEILFANDIIFPEARLPERKHGYTEEFALFIGDLHVGSKLFMEKNFLRFIDFLNGKGENNPEIEKIKYIFLVGDLVAGVGIYPDQDKELNIPNVEEQYAKVAELLSKIRTDIKIIISPGNHDALRIMEPQPLLDEKFAWPLYNLKNVILTGNPCLVNIGAKNGFSGFDVLTYHGYSYHYYAGTISKLILEKAVHNPDLIMHYLLRFRHLAPTHSSTLYFPSDNDPFLIKTIPDILVSAHTHKSAVSYFNNILTVSTSAWESLTAFQEKMGNQPDFCKVPMFNLKTRSIKILDFE